MTDEPTRGSSSVAPAEPNDPATALRRILEARRSVRSYAPTAVDPRLVAACIDAARLAPSPHNSQPWRFAVPWERSVRERMLDAMAAPWRADLGAEGMGQAEVDALLERSRRRVLDAPAAVVVFLDPTAASRWPTDRRQAGERVMALHALGAAIHTFLLAAAARGLGSCWVCSPLFAPREVAAALEVGRHLEAQALITLGYPAVPLKRRGRLSPAEISLTVGPTGPVDRMT